MSYSPQQSSQASWASYAPLAAQADTWERAAFIRRTYLHVLGAVIAFVALEAIVFTAIPKDTMARFMVGISSPLMWLVVLGAFMGVSWLARSWAQSSTSVAAQYAGLGLYVVAQAVIFVPILFVAVHQVNDPMLLPSAAGITLFIFGGLTAVTFITRQDFSFLGAYLWWGGIAALGIIVFGLIFSFSLGFWFSAAMILLASGYILYDTSNIIHHYRTDQHVAAALALFASVAILFWYVLRLLMAMSRR